MRDFLGPELVAILGDIGLLRIFIWSQFSTLYGAHDLLGVPTVGVLLIGM